MAAGKRILVCEDDPVVLRLLQVNLELEGYEVLTAHNGEEALEVVSAQSPDLVVLDIMIPRMDGYQVVNKMKAEESTKDIPVVFVSAKAQQVDIELGKTYGIAGYLTKPFDPAEVIALVARLLG